MHSPYFYVMFQSVIIFQMMYILLQYYYIRKSEYVYYFGYMLCLSVYAAIKYEPHVSFKFISAIDPLAELHFDRALPLLSYFLYYRFARYFAEIHTLIPRLNAVLKKMEWLVLAYVCFELFWECAGLSRHISEIIFWCFSGFLFVTTIFFGVWIFSKRNVLVNILIAGAIMVNIGSLCTVILFYLKHIGSYNYLDPMLPVNLSVLVEMLLFTTGLAYKAKLTEQEKIATQNELLMQTQKNLALNERVNEMRSSIANDFHNDLSASLSSIGIYSSLLIKSIKEKPEQVELLAARISDSASRLTDSILDIVWALNPQTRTLGNVVQKLKLFAIDELEPINTAFDVACDAAILAMPLNANGIRSIFLIHKSFIRFILKRHHCLKIASSIKFLENNLMVELSAKMQWALSIDELNMLQKELNALVGNLKANVAIETTEKSLTARTKLELTNIRD